MKLGIETGSVTNYLMSGTKGQSTPQVGMGITLLHWSDRSAATITRVSPSGKSFWYKDDIATRTDSNGMSECQEYTYTPDPNAPEHRATLRKNGSWKTGGTRISLGYRRAYHDFSF